MTAVRNRSHGDTGALCRVEARSGDWIFVRSQSVALVYM